MSNEGRLQTCKAWRAGVNPPQPVGIGASPPLDAMVDGRSATPLSFVT
jgi:hypothetical protein